MTRAREGAVPVAPARAVHWHTCPPDDDRGPPKTFPACRDGDELLARVGNDVVEVTVEHRHGVRFVGPDGEAVEPDAIAERPRSRSGRSLTENERQTERITVRLPKGYKARLQRLSEEDGYSVAEWIAAMIEMAETELAGLRQRPPKKSSE